MKKISKKIKGIAAQVMKLEHEISLGNDIKINQKKIEDIMLSLNFEEMLQLDEVIMEELDL